MGSNKRPLQDNTKQQDDSEAPARKKRAVYSEHDKDLAKAYNDLADELPTIRLAAAAEIIKRLEYSKDKSTAYSSAIGRLSKGVCSGRKAARLGFSVALTEVFRIVVEQNLLSLSKLVNIILDASQITGNVSGQERRDTLLGRRFAFQALLESGVASSSKCSDEDWKSLIAHITDLAAERSYLRRECSAIIYELLSGLQQKGLSSNRVQQITDRWTEKSLWKNPEGVALWIAVSEFQDVRLPKHVWHHRDPFSDKDRLILAKVMQDITFDDELQHGKKDSKSGARQFSPSFAWRVVLAKLWTLSASSDSESSAFGKFYEAAIDRGFFADISSAERKHFGLQVISIIVREAPKRSLWPIFSPNVARCLVNHLSHTDRDLTTACKSVIKQMIDRTAIDHDTPAVFVLGMMKTAINFDQLTKTKAVSTMLTSPGGRHSMYSCVTLLKGKIKELHGQTGKDAENHYRLLGDALLYIFRTQHGIDKLFIGEDLTLPGWADLALNTLASIALESTSVQPAPAATKRLYWDRLMSCMGIFLKLPVKYAATASTALLDVCNHRTRHAHKSSLGDVLIESASTNIEQSCFNVSRLPKQDQDTQYAMQLMLGMSALGVYGDEPDSVSVLEDLLNAITAKDGGEESNSMLVEIVLSFVSKPSLTYKKLAELTFAALVPSLTEDSLQSILDILQQKEGTAGQQALFADQEEAEVTVRAAASDDDEDMLDVEEDSDVELVNGVVAEDDSDVTASSAEDDSDGDSSDRSSLNVSDSEGEEVDADDDEEAAFDRKLAEALGTSGFEDSDDHGSDMDDDQMMAVEPHLAKIFQERRKVTNTKQDNKGARENIVMFKSRVLDLLSIYVKAQYDNPIVLVLIQPLLALSRITSERSISEKATTVLKQLYDAHNKDKSQVFVQPQELLDVLAEVHEEIQQGGSKLHGNACSRSSLFLVKTLLGIESSYYGQVSDMYNQLQQKWYLDPKSKIQGSFFTEWTSWSLTTKKQK